MPRLSLVLLGVLLLGACSSTVTGSPSPGADRPPATTSASPTEDDTEGGTGSETRDLDPCDLFTPATLAPIGGTYEEAEELELPDGRGCKWSNLDAVTISAVIWDDYGVDDATGTPGQVGDRESKQNYDGAMCSVAVAVGESSRVDVLGLGDAEADSCAAAQQAAEIVEPDLPGGATGG